jgi:4-hydroxybenzoate polyprenyltransferase
MAPVTALIRATHPIPGIGVTVIVLTFGWSVGLEPWRLTILAVVAIFDQASVGLCNDWRDAGRDRENNRLDKPIVRGDVAVSTVAITAVVCLAVSVVATFSLGWQAGVLHMIAVGMAWAYNLWLKQTLLSVVPYAVSFALLPVIVSAALPTPSIPSITIIAAGLVLGVAAHFANVAPDRDGDMRTGIVGLPHRLGQRTGGLVIAIALTAGTMLLVVGSSSPVVWTIGLVSVLLATLAGLAVVLGRTSAWAFRIVILAAVLNVVLLAVRLTA